MVGNPKPAQGYPPYHSRLNLIHSRDTQFYRKKVALSDFRAKYDYIVVSSSIYDRFFAEPERYAQEVNFYRDLFGHEKLLYEITPNWHLGGGTIRVFQLH